MGSLKSSTGANAPARRSPGRPLAAIVCDMARSIANITKPNASSRIRELRLARGWSQDELAARLINPETGKAMTRQTAQRWETDDRELTLAKLSIAAEAFGVSRAQLLPEGDGITPAERDTLRSIRALSHEELAFVQWFLKAASADRRPVLALKHGLYDRTADQARRDDTGKQ